MSYKTVKLATLPIEWKRGSGLKKSDVSNDGKNPCVLYGELFTKHKNVAIKRAQLSYTNKPGQVISKKGDVLIPATSTASRKEMILARQVDSDGIILGGDINIVRATQGVFAEKYLPYFFESLDAYKQLDRYITGSTGIIHISNSGIKNLEIPLPAIAEQEKIVAKIDELFSEIDHSQLLASNSLPLFNKYKLSLLGSAFTGKLTKNIPLHIDEDLTLDDKLTAKLPHIPDEWKYVKLKGLGDLARGKSKHRPRNDRRLFGGPYPFIQTGEVKASGGLITSYKKTYSEFGLSQSKLWPKGTLCITIAANIAETAFLDFDACFPDSVVGFTANNSLVHPKYVKYFIELSKEKIARFAPATAQKNINLKTLEELVIPLCSLAEQEQIIYEIESLFSEINNLESSIPDIKTRGKNLKQSVLSKAFKGELI